MEKAYQITNYKNLYNFKPMRILYVPVPKSFETYYFYLLIYNPSSCVENNYDNFKNKTKIDNSYWKYKFFSKSCTNHIHFAQPPKLSSGVRVSME